MNAIKDKLQVPGVSIWVTAYLLVVIAFGLILGTPALFDNGLADTQTIGWGGRELGIGIGAVIALFLRSATAYFIIFVIGLFRELSDLLEALDETPANTTSAITVGAFIVIGAICAWFSWGAMRRQPADQV